ncbi:pyridoxamine 5'-phosphate oxidase family protein, partial [Rhizobiaceae sp. 2RAB30]
YRSAMCFGTAGIVDDADEKAHAIRGVVERFYPGRFDTLRPVNAQELKATTIIGMRIEDASAKVRAKGVGDDEEDYGHPAWAGVIPIRTVIETDEPCPRLLPGIARPDGLAAYRQGRRLDDALAETQHAYEAAPA